MRRFLTVCAVSLAMVFSTASASAQEAPVAPGLNDDVTDQQRAEALRLFNAGRAEMQVAGKLNEACDVLTQSYALHHRGDTLLNLAECHHRQGKTATAWREFDEAIRYAQEVEFTEAIAAAAELRDKLAKDLSQLVVEVPVDASKVKGLIINLDDKPLPKEQWGQKLFVDPGPHHVTLSAAGYVPFDKTTTVKDQSDHAVITVVLVQVPAPPPAPKPVPPPRLPMKKTVKPGHAPVWSIVVGSAGIVMMGVAIGTGIDTAKAHSQLDRECGKARDNCPRGYDFQGPRSREVRSFGMFVGFGVAGIAATTAGIVGLATGLQPKTKNDTAFLPWASSTGGGLAISGSLR